MKRLFADIETSPNVVLSWRIGYKINLDHENLLKERAIICIGYKWEGQKKAKALTWDAQQCDRAMLAEFIKVAGQADEIVMHNGDQFDLPWIKTRCIYHGLPTMPTYKTIDTLQWARRKFNFNSNKLDYIAKFVGLGGKLKTEFGLWKSIVLDNNRQALDRMVRYCKRDVELLERVYQRMAAHVPHKTHVGVMAGGEGWHCPHCGSDQVKTNRTLYTASGTAQYQMRCRKCKRYYSISARSAAAYREAKKEAA